MKPKLVCLLFLTAFISITSFAQGKHAYRFTIDLNTVDSDKVAVELLTPAIASDEIIYNIPKIVPGTYSEDDFGRFIDDFSALDKNGNALPVERINVNSWKISSAKKLAKIKYKVNDTFDDFGGTKPVFEPTGSNIQKDTDYLINNHCFLGYFDGMKVAPYHLTVLHPTSLYGSSPLTDLDKSDTKDEFEVESYNRIVDNPIMYSAPDTSSITVGNSQVLISVYSPNKKITSAFLAENFNRLLQAQAKYLGGTLPVAKYAFIIYLFDKPGLSGSNGALEHSYSSVYYLPEGDPKNILQFFLDVAAHEFFHIVTPLSLHSEEIQYFDFNTPKMSKHLWLYEGSTEYHAHMVQEKYGLTTREDLLNVLSQKITTSRQQFNDTLPFTVMSAGCLHDYAKQYGNVYQKGALIAMCLDIKLHELSGGKYGILDMVFDLSKKYGKDKPFKDDELFDEIGKITYPQIKEFLENYVAGNKPLPLEEIFASVGVELTPVQETKDSTFTMGSISFAPGKDRRITIIDVSNMNAFGKAMGYQVNDVLVSINGKEVHAGITNAVITALYKTAKVGDRVEVIVKRKDASGEEQDVTLSGAMTKIPVKKFNVLSFNPSPSDKQKTLQDNWLNAK